MSGEAEAIEYRSVSQLKEYEQCPYRYYLHRKKKAREKPAAWLPQGLGVHEAAEFWEKSGRTASVAETTTVFGESYAKHTNRLTADTPNLKYWFRSGPYDGERDIERRFKIGWEQTEKYIEYYTEKKPKETIFQADDGTLACEFPFEVQLGDVWVRGFVDQIVWNPDSKSWVVRDVKTGKSPGDEKQLGMYRVAAKKVFDIDAETGDYWMAKSGKPTIEYDLSEWTESYATDVFGELDQQINAEEFPPLPEADKCRFCSVNTVDMDGNQQCEFAASQSF